MNAIYSKLGANQLVKLPLRDVEAHNLLQSDFFVLFTIMVIFMGKVSARLGVTLAPALLCGSTIGADLLTPLFARRLGLQRYRLREVCRSLQVLPFTTNFSPLFYLCP